MKTTRNPRGGPGERSKNNLTVKFRNFSVHVNASKRFATWIGF